MYAFRKPFAAGSFVGEPILGLEPKTLFVISQIAGYATSKYLGVRWVSELGRRYRLHSLIVLIGIAEMSLLLFALAPAPYKAAALFLNGLPLGMIWGLVVRYLEGRRESEILLAALSCSFIVASGVVKDIARALMSWGVTENWMPAVTGALFFPGFVISASLLDRVPEPSSQDELQRQARTTMNRNQRKEFAFQHLPGLSLLLFVYLLLTAFRDYRDNYGIELFSQLGYGQQPGLFSSTELAVALGVMVLMAGLGVFRRRISGLVAVFAIMTVGMACIGLSTFALQRQWLTGQGWMIGTGLGAYLAYVPFSSFLFDRIMAATYCVGTAVFAVNLADAIGYSGSTLMQLYKDIGTPTATHLEFFTTFSYALSGCGILCLGCAGAYFLRKARQCESSDAAAANSTDPSC